MMTKEREDVRLMKSTAEIWADVLDIIKPQVKEATFNMFFANAVCQSVNGDEATVALIIRNWWNLHSSRLRTPRSKSVLSLIPALLPVATSLPLPTSR